MTVGGRWGQTTAWGLRLRKENLGEELAELACPDPQVSSWVRSWSWSWSWAGGPQGWLNSWWCAHHREPSNSGRSLCEAAGGQQEERVQGPDPVHMLLGQHWRHRHPDRDGTQRGAPGPDARVSRWS